MPLFNASETRFVEAVAGLAHCNPFLPERIVCEQAVLGADFDAHLSDWNVRYEDEHDHPNLQRVLERSEAALERARERLARHPDTYTSELPLYEDLLAAGGTRTYVEALKPFGLDPREKAFWAAGCKRLEKLVDEFETLV